ncbi:hypothetical protein HK104_010732 [Borealophlyctis nickersoniae]|nr:hypothetical protein HK104_010732 [Borealophlyctis nickersoniae]
MMLLRVVDENRMKDGEPTLSAFIPGDRDPGGLSVDVAEEAYDAAAAFEAYKEPPFPHPNAHSVWGVTVEEALGSGLTVWRNETPNNRHHTLVIFNNRCDRWEDKKKSEKRKLAQGIFLYACARGALFTPNATV